MEVIIKTKLIAHRGDTKNYPENTLSAFKAALENGADAIELDLHLTSDGELIIHHDYYLGNPDDGEGKIYEKDLKGFTEEFLTKVIALVKKYDLASVIEFTSPNTYNLTRIKALEPTFKVGTFVAALPGWMDKQLGQTLAINNALLGTINVLHCPFSLIDKKFIQVAHDKELLIHAADCDLDEDLRAAFSMALINCQLMNLVLPSVSERNKAKERVAEVLIFRI